MPIRVKAQRFFKERRIRFQFVDLADKGLSKGELRSVAASVPLDQLLNRSSRRFVERGLAHAALDPGRIEAVLLEEPQLFNTPVVRNGQTGDGRLLSAGVERLGVRRRRIPGEGRLSSRPSARSQARGSGACGISRHCLGSWP